MEIPQNVSWIIAATGAFLLLAGILGGGLEIKEIKLPHITNFTRAVCVVFGVVLLSSAIIPPLLPPKTKSPEVIVPFQEIDETSSGESSANDKPAVPDTEPVAALLEVPALHGFTAEEVRGSLAALGLELGPVSTEEVWAADGTVINQSPDGGKRVPPHTPVSIVLADSTRRYRAKRRIEGTDNQEVDATVTYEASLIRDSNSGNPIGRFSVLEARVTGLGPEVNDIIDALSNQPGFVPLEVAQISSLETHWTAYEVLAQDLGHTMAVETMGDSPSFKSLGPSITLALIGQEVLFDIRSIFSVGPQRNLLERGFELQTGQGIISTIRAKGSKAVGDAGRTRRLTVERRTRDDETFRRVGSITYDADDGSLVNTNLLFKIADEGPVYRLEIEPF